MSQLNKKNSKNEKTSTSKERALDKSESGNGILIIGILLIAFSLFLILAPIVHTISNGIKFQYTPVLIIGTAIFILGFGLTKRQYWAWIGSTILISVFVLGCIFSYIVINNTDVFIILFINVIILIILYKYRNQVGLKKKNK